MGGVPIHACPETTAARRAVNVLLFQCNKKMTPSRPETRCNGPLSYNMVQKSALPSAPTSPARSLRRWSAADIQAIRTPGRPRQEAGGFQGTGGGEGRWIYPLRRAVVTAAAAKQTGALHGRVGRGQGEITYTCFASPADTSAACHFSLP